MAKEQRPLFDLKSIVATVIGGMGLLVVSLLFNSFFSSPPTRAEYDSFKAETQTRYKSIDSKLETLDKRQQVIYNHLLGE